ncbi:hypothetical protein HNR30_004131 [Nonomuraea soli]|uniref:Uncharacterized protein n=1 Tax=Nonomuraea soli TaxID=1032476 RepID=A0A7W0HRE3_9ACTN|nr:hypothetical protein [Nonomuraea soli]
MPALAAQAVTDPVGVDAFAARADGPFGVLGSLLAGGGIWNAEAGVPGQDDWWQATARLLLAVAGLAGFVRLGRSKERPAWWTGLAVASAAGLVIAALGPLVLEQLIALWPGFGPLRDGQVYVAPMVLAVAVGLSSLPVPRPLVIVAPLLVLPTFALGAFGRLDAVRYPGDWRAVQRIVNEDSAPGALLTLPWSAYRAHAWNEHRVILDPATKLFDRRVVWNDGLRIGMADGRVLVLDVEDPLARKVGEQLGRNVLDESTIRYVLLPASENTFLTDDPAWRPVFQGRELLLLRR